MSAGTGTVTAVAAWEMRGAVRSRWVLAAGSIYAAAAVLLALDGLRSMSAVGITGVRTSLDGLLSLGVLLPPLVGLLLGAGAVAGARERGVLAMMSAQPIKRSHIGWGMLVGLTGALWAALAVGLGLAAVVLAPAATMADLPAVGVLVVATLAASALGVSLGLVISVLASSRSQATAVAAGMWFFAAIGIDLLFVGLAPGLGLGSAGLLGAVLGNPLEAIRIAALMAVDTGSVGSFGAYLDHTFGTPGSFVILGVAVATWTITPMLVGMRLLRRRDV